jgi:hypothetical protein
VTARPDKQLAPNRPSFSRFRLPHRGALALRDLAVHCSLYSWCAA